MLVPIPGNLTFLITGLNHGGAETQLCRLVPRLRGRGWNVLVITMVPSSGLREELEQTGVPVIPLDMKPGAPSLGALLKTIGLLRQWKPTIVINFMFHAIILGRIAARISRIPVIVSSIRSENNGGPSRDRLLRITDPLGNLTIVNSQRVAESLTRQGIVPKHRVQVIHNGLNMDDYRCTAGKCQTIRDELGVGDGQFLWVAVGNLREPKDYPSLLNAFRMVHQQRPHARLRVAGEGPLHDQLQSMARDLQLEDAVKFIGFRHDIPGFLASSDAFVLSSAWEGLPNALMEACAAGKPTVSTNVGGVTELIDDGESGFIVPPRNPEELARKMLHLMALPEELRRHIGAAARQKMEAQFGMEHITDLWEQLFQRLIAKIPRQG